MDPRSFRWPSSRVKAALLAVVKEPEGRIFVHELLAESGMLAPYRSADKQGRVVAEDDYGLGRRSMGQFLFNALQSSDLIEYFRLMQDEALTEQGRIFDPVKKKEPHTYPDLDPTQET